MTIANVINDDVRLTESKRCCLALQLGGIKLDSLTSVHGRLLEKEV
jgi:hypothetical protein